MLDNTLLGQLPEKFPSQGVFLLLTGGFLLEPYKTHCRVGTIFRRKCPRIRTYLWFENNFLFTHQKKNRKTTQKHTNHLRIFDSIEKYSRSINAYTTIYHRNCGTMMMKTIYPRMKAQFMSHFSEEYALCLH